MKILLINPPSLNPLGSVLPDIVEGERGYNPPLGLLYLAGYIRHKSPDFEIKVIDAMAEELGYPVLAQKIREFRPDLVGVTAMSYTVIDALETARTAKREVPGAKVVFGGPHVHIYGTETLALGSVDYIVLGEGDLSFYDLALNINDPEKLKSVPGLLYRDRSGQTVHTGFPAPIMDLNALPMPARDLIDNNLYSSILGTSKLVTTMVTSRGCPYQCLFCDRPHLGKTFRARSAENVVAEIEECLKYGIREFLMYDDTFTINRQRVFDICDLIIRKKLDILWDIRARVNTVDVEMLKKLKQAGCVRVHYGVESGNERILKILRKGITKDQVRAAFAATRAAGIETLAYFMIGCPTETEAEVEETVRFALELKADYVHMTALTPFPATDLYDMALKQGIIPRDVWKEFAQNPTRDFAPPLYEDILKRGDIQRLISGFYRRFYFRPSYIANRLWRLRSWEELKKKARAGWRMLRI